MVRGVLGAALVGVMVAALGVSAEAAKEPPKATTRPAQKEQVKSVRGQITALDIEAKTLTVEVKQRQEMQQVVVATDPNTEFLLDSEPVSIVDLRPGMRVTFQPETGVATRVSARSMNSKEEKEYKQRKDAEGKSAAQKD